MNNKNKINNEHALFSLAMIDLKTYTQVIVGLDKLLDQPTFVLNYVLKQERTQEMKNLFKNYAFADFAKVQKYLNRVKKSILKYQSKLEGFLQENPNANKEFNDQMDILIPLFEDKEKFVNNQVNKCFEYAKSFEQNASANEVL